METGTLDLEGRGLTSLPPALFENARMLTAVTRAKLSGNKLRVSFVAEGSDACQESRFVLEIAPVVDPHNASFGC